MMKKKKPSKIYIPPNTKVWQHELLTAEALSTAGYSIEFMKPMATKYQKTPDVIINNCKWEIKSPKSDKISAIERNLKRGTKQADCIIFDSQRMKRIHDSTIQKVLVRKYKNQKTIQKLLFVNRKREVIDIEKLA